MVNNSEDKVFNLTKRYNYDVLSSNNPTFDNWISLIYILKAILARLIVFNANFNNITVISWRSVLSAMESGENHQPARSH